MAATVLNIAGMVAVKRTPLDGDIDGIAGRVKLLGNAVYVAFPGSNPTSLLLFWVESSSPPATSTRRIPAARGSQAP